jgi:hypothetical protein
MTISANRRKAMYAGVAALAAVVGVGVAWQRQPAAAKVPEELKAFWAAEFDAPAGAPERRRLLHPADGRGHEPHRT